jgi:hypothetical protein
MVPDMHSSYQHQATSYANLSLASAHAIVNDLHRRAAKLAPRFADETAEAGCTNLRPADDQPRRQQVWDMLAEALSWNLIADHADLVVAAKLAEDRGVDFQVGCTYGRGHHLWVQVNGDIVAEYKDQVQASIEAYEAAGIRWTTSAGKVWPSGSSYDAECPDCQAGQPHTHTASDSRTCRHCDEPLEIGPYQRLVTIRSGDDGGTYDYCPTSPDGLHHPTPVARV